MEKFTPTILVATLLAVAAGCESREEKEYKEYRVEQALTLVERLIKELSAFCSETLKPQPDEGKTVFSDRYRDIPAVSTDVVEGGIANTRPLEGDYDGLASASYSGEDICRCNKETCSHANNWAISTEMTDTTTLTIDEGKSRVSANAFESSATQKCEHEEPELDDEGHPSLKYSGETGTFEPVMIPAGHDCTDFSAIELGRNKCTVEVEGGEKFKAPDFARCKRIFAEARRVQGEIRAAIGKRTADLRRTHRPQLR